MAAGQSRANIPATVVPFYPQSARYVPAKLTLIFNYKHEPHSLSSKNS